ncbi:DUF3592 domain-containing protein [Asanoa sp. WMMD1127]|uniref:DUF3592 domain-containing protein n=1 Tax=Asanoa sp. WMMD1127 TaxID=3016107 RepID=UPI0024171D03|nr:DUF3592 domain-containing protein [Asanoa sp. WMMD1127]MDG4821706.1 DUF3592 domain-containing protein [Asanoa sp. WMMD1127]
MTGRRRPLPPLWLFVGGGAAVVVAFAVATFGVWRNDTALEERGVETSGRVVAVSDGKIKRVRVEFSTPDGRRVEALVGQGDEARDPRPRVNDTVPIVYDPDNPTDDVRDSRVEPNHHMAYTLLGVTIFGAVGVPLAAWHLAREHRRRRAASS